MPVLGALTADLNINVATNPPVSDTIKPSVHQAVDMEQPVHRNYPPSAGKVFLVCFHILVFNMYV